MVGKVVGLWKGCVLLNGCYVRVWNWGGGVIIVIIGVMKCYWK